MSHFANYRGWGQSCSDTTPIPSNERVWVISDDNNLTRGAIRDYGGRWVDYNRLLAPVRHLGALQIEVVASGPWMSASRQRFLEDAWRADVWVADRNADALVAGSMLRGAREADRVILCAGDRDYVHVVDFVQSKGVAVEVWSFATSLSRELEATCDVLRVLNQDVLLPEARAPRPRKSIRTRFNPWTLAQATSGGTAPSTAQS